MMEPGPKMRRDIMNFADGVPTEGTYSAVIHVKTVSARSVLKEIWEG